MPSHEYSAADGFTCATAIETRNTIGTLAIRHMWWVITRRSMSGLSGRVELARVGRSGDDEGAAAVLATGTAAPIITTLWQAVGSRRVEVGLVDLMGLVVTLCAVIAIIAIGVQQEQRLLDLPAVVA
jgi:hypothetical protein